MKTNAREARREAIEIAAIEVLEEKGYEGLSMLGVAKQAKASNETLYRWYGDKKGLFKSLVLRNADQIRVYLDDQQERHATATQTLENLGPVLLSMLFSNRAIALNRAAAADASGELGSALAMMGRNFISPRITELIHHARKETGFLAKLPPASMDEFYFSILIGDLQVRCVTHALAPLSDEIIAARAEWAWLIFLTMSSPPKP
ncbi:TetR/AcrR family transcriptional regulator [Roseibium sediminis]|uniref:TetR/AcrR family transcriptional regulator n=1 Tax=Roseibium sediminis TaxID=1775174 RepID=UPI00123DA98F|nr:TetR/AcrR family transcriptional regulator [Roseibium sediminis]